MVLRNAAALAGTLALGLVIGILASDRSPRVVLARGSDRAGESTVTTGTIATIYNPVTKTSVQQDAVYLLDYKSGRLLAAIPEMRTTGQSRSLLGPFSERDLVKDFQIAPGGTPKFMMTTLMTPEGWEPILVFEATTNQVASYRLETNPASNNTSVAPKFELIEKRSFSDMTVNP